MNLNVPQRVILSATFLVVIGAVIYLVASRPGLTESPGRDAQPSAQDKEAVATRAAAGDHQAQLQMGLWTLDSAKKPEDYDRAADWLRKAGDAGDSEAQYRLGTLYQTGRGIRRDETNALSWFKKAAAQNHVSALYNLGSMYETGRGVAPNSEEAARFMEQAAELGDGYAQYNMARRREEGHGISADLVEALKWYVLADEGGIAGAKDGRRVLESHLQPEQREAARRALAEFKQRFHGPAAAGH